MGLLEAPADLHGGLVLTQDGQSVMRGNQKVELVEPRHTVKSSREKSKQVTMALMNELNDSDSHLRQALIPIARLAHSLPPRCGQFA